MKPHSCKWKYCQGNSAYTSYEYEHYKITYDEWRGHVLDIEEALPYILMDAPHNEENEPHETALLTAYINKCLLEDA